MLTDVGAVDLAVPRDRNGSFEPQIVRKGQTRLEGFNERIIALPMTSRWNTYGPGPHPRPFTCALTCHKPVHPGDGRGGVKSPRCGSRRAGVAATAWLLFVLPCGYVGARLDAGLPVTPADLGYEPVHKPERWGLDLRVAHCASSTPVSIPGLFLPTGAPGQPAGSAHPDKYGK